MSIKHSFYHNRKLKMIAYEEMIDKKSFIFIKCGGDEVKIPISAWRELNKTWNDSGWDTKFDSLDGCIEPLVAEVE